ncbi:14482_t:CDS:2 [Cetraspora pellucida]|uniref:14482_t:CDS:1 n=1 Tax=Cetraspora pellucida TaxID=1433469 RepID=A0ACA9PN54_9GLOM|nr:14482_t:CDS:2 [Cetraspora pellucida]
MSKSGIISLKKPTEEGRRIFRNKIDGIRIVFEKWRTGNIRVLFVKDNKIVDVPTGYKFRYSYGDRYEDGNKASNVDGILCYMLSNDLYNYKIFYNDKIIFNFYNMMQFSIWKDKDIFGYNRKKNKT